MRGSPLAFSIMLIAVTVSWAIGQPKFEVAEGTKFDFGPINRGKVASKNLTLQNTGTDTLVIGRVEVSCGCTGTMVSNSRIAPGSSGTLLITFNSRNFSGVVHKSVTINSNAQDAPQTLVEFGATVIDEVKITPEQFLFRDAKAGILSTASITVRNEGKEKLEFTGFRSQLGGLSINLPAKAIEPGKSAELVAVFTPKNTIPVLSDGVFINTSNPRQPEIYIPIYGNVKEFRFE